MRLSPSIDWLSVKQEAPAGEDYPVFGESKVYRVSLLDGQVSGEFIKGQRAQGSFDTSIYVSCDQRALHISGNPSRWGRLDNVFGFSSMADCLAVYDGLLERLGLPLLDHLRCVLTRVDLAQNFDVGQGNQLSYLRALAQHSLRSRICIRTGEPSITIAAPVGCTASITIKVTSRSKSLRRFALRSSNIRSGCGGICRNAVLFASRSH